MCGQQLHSLDLVPQASISPRLEFVYLRENLLASLDGPLPLHQLKILDLSFNELREVALPALAECTALQQLHLTGNLLEGLRQLPVLPRLEVLSVSCNRLKSLQVGYIRVNI